MTDLTAIFSHVCGQGRCFMVDGSPLPVCQRCTGLYIGAAITFVWIITTGVWRRGLPGRWALIAQIAALTLALLGGIHLIDTGPCWRLSCGLWTGYVVMTWLVASVSHLRQTMGEPLRWRPLDQALACLLPFLAAILPAIGFVPTHHRTTWTTLLCLGVASLLTAAIVAIAALCGKLKQLGHHLVQQRKALRM